MIGLMRSRAFGLLLALTAIVLVAAITFGRPRLEPQADDGVFTAPLSDLGGSTRPGLSELAATSRPPAVSTPATATGAQAESSGGAAQLPPALAALQGVIPDRDITADEAPDAPSNLHTATGVDTSPALVVDQSHARPSERIR